MRNSKYIWLLAILVIIAFWFLLDRSHLQAPSQPAATNTIRAANSATPIATNSSVSSQSSVTTVRTNDLSYSHDPNTPTDIMNRYQNGLISKGEAMQEASLAKNKSMDIYGKVVDQYGQPVARAKVQGALTITLGFMSENVEYYSTETDANGRFSFLGLNGSSLGIHPQRDGYLYYLKLPPQRPNNYQPDPNNPVVFDMWKLHGPETLVGQAIDAKIPHDGTPVIFDMATGKESPIGDLQITLTRLPLEVRRSGQGFDWSFKVQMLHGGLFPEDDSYPYWAPENGYEQAYEFNASSNDVSWDSRLTKFFYIRTSGGQYGRMQTDVSASLTPARIVLNFTINPSGSQNLEPPSAQ